MYAPSQSLTKSATIVKKSVFFLFGLYNIPYFAVPSNLTNNLSPGEPTACNTAPWFLLPCAKHPAPKEASTISFNSFFPISLNFFLKSKPHIIFGGNKPSFSPLK